MTRKTEIENKPLKIGDLSKVTGVRQSTLKFYTEIGILPYEQKDTRLARWYDKDEVMKRLQEIQELKKKGLNIEEIIGYYARKRRSVLFAKFGEKEDEALKKILGPKAGE